MPLDIDCLSNLLFADCWVDVKSAAVSATAEKKSLDDAFEKEAKTLWEY